MGQCYMIGTANKQFQSFANINSILEIAFELLSLVFSMLTQIFITSLNLKQIILIVPLCKPTLF